MISTFISKILKIILVSTLFQVFFALASIHAFAQTTRTVVLKPRLVYQLVAADMQHVGYYDSPSAAWAAYMDYIANYPYSGPIDRWPRNFRPCEDVVTVQPGYPQYAYYWGAPVSWCHDYFSEDYGGWRSTSFISASETCPSGIGLNWRVSTGDGNVHNDGNAFIRHRTCDISVGVVFPEKCGGVGNPIFPSTGTKRQTDLDYSSATGLLKFERTYTSNSGAFQSVLSIPFVRPAPGGIGSCTVMPSQLTDPHLMPGYCYEQINPIEVPANAFFIDVTGAVEEFQWNGTFGVPLLPYFNDTLSISPDQKSYVLKRPSEEKFYVFRLDGQVQSAVDRSGKSVVFSYSDSATPISIAPGSGYMLSQADNFGRIIGFSYSATGVLSTLTDPAGSLINYGYASVSGAAIVASARTATPSLVTYQDGSSKQYIWDEQALSTGTRPGVNRLTGITDELGNRFASFGYANSAAVSTEHAGSVEKFSLVDGRRSGSGPVQVTQPNGSTVVQAYNLVNGVTRLTSQSQPAGAGCTASTSALTYNANGNRASEDDFNGGRACYAYDTGRNLETSRVEGLAGGSSGAVCGDVTGGVGALPAGGRKVSTVWHPDWRLEAQRAEPGKLTTFVYNGQPDPLNGNALASCAPSSALLPDGKPIAVLCKQVEQATTDADGHLGFGAALQSGVPNRVRSWTYNQFGQVLTETDPLGHVTSSVYYPDTSFTGTDPYAVGHTIGDLQTVTNALGKVTTYTQYDKHGNVLRMQDANGVETVNTYDLRQRLLSVSVAGQTTGYTYDAAGQLLRITAPDASWIGYEYDAAHRRIATKDNLGNRIDYTLDNAGNQTAQAVSDPAGNLARSLNRSFDALGRVQQTTGRE